MSRKGDRQLQVPYVDYRNTKAIIESLPGMIGGETAYATDNPSAPFGKFGTGTWHWSNNEPGGGGGGIDTIGFAGLDEGVPIGTGSFLNVTGARATFTRSGTMFNLEISPDAQEIIGIYGLSKTTPLGTGTSLSVGDYFRFSITGTTLYLDASIGTGTNQLVNNQHDHNGGDGAPINISSLTSDSASTWTPTWDGLGIMTVTVTTLAYARYFQIGKFVFFWVRGTVTTSGSAGSTITISTPINPINNGSTIAVVATVVDGTPNVGRGFVSYAGANTINVVRQVSGADGNYSLAAGIIIIVSGFYEVP